MDRLSLTKVPRRMTTDEPFTSSGGNLPRWRSLQSRKMVKIPRRLHTWSRVALTIFFAFAGMVSFIPWTQTVPVQGRLSAYSPFERPQEIHAQINGNIRKWHVTEGMVVKKGDLVLELEDVNPQFMAQDLLQRLDQSREALQQRRQAALERADILETTAQGNDIVNSSGDRIRRSPGGGGRSKNATGRAACGSRSHRGGNRFPQS